MKRGEALSTRWWWIRHAHVPSIGIYGQNDLSCDTSDGEACAYLARILPTGAVLITTDLQRTIQTAAAIAQAGIDFPDPIKVPELREQHFGDWQGLTYEEIAEDRQADIHRHWVAPAFERSPNGESFTDVVARVGKVIPRLNAAHAGRDIVCVAHNGTILAAIAIALNMHPETALTFAIDNLSLTRIDYLQGKQGSYWDVKTVNAHVRY